MNELAAFLPPKLVEIAEVIGLDAALKLAAAFGGQRLFVPKTFETLHPITLHLGLAASAKLSEIYGGDAIVVPMATRYHKALINAQILKELETKPATEVARKYGRHLFSIYNLKAKAEADKQGSLL